MKNQERFDTESYASGGPIVKESTLVWSEIPTHSVKRNIRVEESILERDDNQFMSINGVTDDEDTFFTLKKWSDGTRTDAFHTRLLLSYSMSLDAQKITRNVYNFFTLLGDVGGLFGLLISVASSFAGVLSFQKADNFLTDHIYDAGPKYGKTDKWKGT